MAKLAIIGTGFVGTSLGLALRPSRLFDTIVGHDVDRGRAQEAKRLGAIDDDVRSANGVVREAAVVIVTVPGEELASVFAEVGRALTTGAVVSDTSLWKAAALKAAAFLPADVHFIGGRPVLDAAGDGPSAASADAFRNAVYCLTPDAVTDGAAIEAMSAVVSAVGAQEYFLGPEEHDGLTAGGELLPAAMLAALVAALTGDGAWKETGRLAGDTLNRFATMAEELDGRFWEAASANSAALGRWLDIAADQLQLLREQLATADPKDVRRDWDVTTAVLQRWRGDKRMLQEASMLSKSDLRPNLFGNLSALNRLRGNRPK